MIFDKISYDQITAPSIILFAFGAFFMMVPVYRIVGKSLSNKSCYNQHENVQEKNMDDDYENFRTQFLSEYDRSNPVTNAAAMKDYFNFLQRKVELIKENSKTLRIEKRTATWLFLINFEARLRWACTMVTHQATMSICRLDSSMALRDFLDP